MLQKVMQTIDPRMMHRVVIFSCGHQVLCHADRFLRYGLPLPLPGDEQFCPVCSEVDWDDMQIGKGYHIAHKEGHSTIGMFGGFLQDPVECYMKVSSKKQRKVHFETVFQIWEVDS